MRELVRKIQEQGVDLGRNILKVDGFINHQLEPRLTQQIGVALAERLLAAGMARPTKVVTAEVSGIAFALQTGIALDVPAIFARKIRPVTMPAHAYSKTVVSPTKGTAVELVLNPEYVTARDRVVLVDDFLASGQTLIALHELVSLSGARIVGIGCVIEKSFQGGRAALSRYGIPLAALAVVHGMQGGVIQVESGSRPTDG